jgi:short-subunit dehydrogenase
MAQRPWAVVTGASSGLGVDFARQLVTRGWNLVLTARRADRLEQLAATLRQQGADVVVCPCDLQDPAGRDSLWQAATANNRPLTLWVNNAGFGGHQDFAEADWTRWQGMIDLNITALTDLTWRFVRHAQAHGQRARVLQVASIGAWMPSPYMSVYTATKSYVRDLTAALSVELAGSSVTCHVLCPGPTRTEFVESASMTVPKGGDLAFMDSAPVVQDGLNALFADKTIRVSGLLNRITCAVSNLAPQTLVARIAMLTMGKPAGK